MHPILAQWYLELQNDPVITGDTMREAVANFCSFHVATALPITEQQFVEFLHALKNRRFEQARQMGILPVRFYVWHDPQTGQIRHSLIRGIDQKLPFGAEVAHSTSLDEIVSEYFCSPFRDGIPIEEMPDEHFNALDSEHKHTVSVWVENCE